MISITTTLPNPQLRADLHRISIVEGNPIALGESLRQLHHRFKCPYKYFSILMPIDVDNDIDAGYSYVAMNGEDFMFLNFIQFQIEY